MQAIQQLANKFENATVFEDRKWLVKALVIGGNSFKYDAILDSGANNNILPSLYESSVKNLVAKPGTLFLGDDSKIPTYATASYGILDNVILCHNIRVILN